MQLKQIIQASITIKLKISERLTITAEDVSQYNRTMSQQTYK